MEQIDPRKAQAVWQRVMEARYGHPPMPPMPGRPPEGQPMPEHPFKEELRQWLAEILTRVRAYRSVNAGRNTPMLRRMASEEQAHYRQLAALYTRLYGRRPEVLAAAAPGRRSLAAFLQDSYGAEQRAVRQWRAAAMRYPMHAGMFDHFARSDRQHAEQLRRIMAQIR